MRLPFGRRIMRDLSTKAKVRIRNSGARETVDAAVETVLVLEEQTITAHINGASARVTVATFVQYPNRRRATYLKGTRIEPGRRR
jgi:hypothetical protein